MLVLEPCVHDLGRAITAAQAVVVAAAADIGPASEVELVVAARDQRGIAVLHDVALLEQQRRSRRASTVAMSWVTNRIVRPQRRMSSGTSWHLC